MPFSRNCNLLKEQLSILEKNLFIKREKTFFWNWQIKSSGKSQKSKKELRKRGTFWGSCQKDITKRNNDILVSFQKFHKRA